MQAKIIDILEKHVFAAREHHTVEDFNEFNKLYNDASIPFKVWLSNEMELIDSSIKNPPHLPEKHSTFSLIAYFYHPEKRRTFHICRSNAIHRAIQVVEIITKNENTGAINIRGFFE